MKIRKKDSTDERCVLIGMIVDSIVLGRISSKWTGRMFRSRWANIVAGWCLKYYKRYEKAPMQRIENLYEHWSSKEQNKDVIKLVSKFLESLSAEYESLKTESNSDYVIDVAGRYFNRVNIERLLESVQDELDANKIDEAHSKLLSYSKIEMGVGEGIDVFQDDEAIKEAFADKKEPLIKYPGALGEFFSRAFERDAFLAFLGPEKRGKSFWLLDIAFQAVCQRRKVAFFEAGDSSKNQIMRRFMVRAARHPLYFGEVTIPLSIEKDEDDVPTVQWKKERFKENLDWRTAKEACKKIMRKKTKSKKSYFKLSCHPNSTLSISMIESILQDWERMGWTPDLIVIDYADILDMSYSGIEGRDRINETWKRLRSLSQKAHCLLVTATQADAKSYGKELIDIGNFSDDKRKAGHVTGMIGLNQTSDEEKAGIMRLNWAVDMRDNKSNPWRCVYVAECREIANVAVKSCF